jgi:hypothetical protein
MYKKYGKKLPKPKKGAWFIPVRWSYLPCSWQGWLTYVPFVYYLLATFSAVDRHSHSVSDTLFGIIPFWVAGAVIMQWLASHKS